MAPLFVFIGVVIFVVGLFLNTFPICMGGLVLALLAVAAMHP